MSSYIVMQVPMRLFYGGDFQGNGTLGSAVHIASLTLHLEFGTSSLQGFPDKAELGSAVRFAFLEGDPADLAVLRKAEAGNAAAVVVAGMGERGAKEADALVLTTLLLVQVWPRCRRNLRGILHETSLMCKFLRCKQHGAEPNPSTHGSHASLT